MFYMHIYYILYSYKYSVCYKLHMTEYKIFSCFKISSHDVKSRFDEFIKKLNF